MRAQVKRNAPRRSCASPGPRRKAATARRKRPREALLYWKWPLSIRIRPGYRASRAKAIPDLAKQIKKYHYSDYTFHPWLLSLHLWVDFGFAATANASAAGRYTAASTASTDIRISTLCSGPSCPREECRATKSGSTAPAASPTA